MDQFSNQVIERTDGTQYWYWNVACIVERMHGPNALLIRAALPTELVWALGFLHTAPMAFCTQHQFWRKVPRRQVNDVA